MIRMTDPEIKVVIFGEHCWNTLGQIRSFGEVGVRPDVVFISTEPSSIERSKYINEFVRFESFDEGLNHIRKKYGGKAKKIFISTDSDSIVSLLDKNYDALKDDFIFFNAGEQGRLSSFMPKNVQGRLAESVGLRVPKSEIVKNGELPKTLNYPVFTKSLDCYVNNWKKDYYICQNEQMLIDAFKKINREELLIQEFIEKKTEVALEGISFNEGENLYLPIQGEYLRTKPGLYGSWKLNEKYKLGEELKEKIQCMLKLVKYTGVFEVEFLKDKDDNLFFLEINFRHTQYNHALTEMGANFGMIYLKSILNGHLCVDAKPLKSPSLVMNEVRDYSTYVETGERSMIRWMLDLLLTRSFYVFDRNDDIRNDTEKTWRSNLIYFMERCDFNWLLKLFLFIKKPI